MSILPGFSVIFWVKDESSLISGLSGTQKQSMIREILRDVGILISNRWNLDCTNHHLNGTDYLYCNNTRFNVSGQTLRNAIGTLTDHVEFQKGSCNTSPEQHVDYRMCKLKWQVPEQVTDTSTSGWGDREQESTSQMNKRKRY